MYIFANFKDYLDYEQTLHHMEQLIAGSATSSHTITVFPSMLAFVDVVHMCANTSFTVGIQHCSDGASAARTGDVSALHAKAAGAAYVLVGHSEQRHIGGETDAMVAAQCIAAVSSDIIPVLCVGETSQELAAGTARARIAEQLAVLRQLPADAKCIIAYEPVWAIQGSGTGEVCHPQDVTEMHAYIYEHLQESLGRSFPILFGGSVNSENVVSYTSLPYIDGVLVGSAATQIESFTAILTALQ
jgi:triosephosphate isomerase